jgi:hypothetical protein
MYAVIFSLHNKEKATTTPVVAFAASISTDLKQ